MLYPFGQFLFDADQELLFRSGMLIPLKPKVAWALRLLLESHGVVVTKDFLMGELWGDTFVEDNNLTQCITTLRKALGDDGTAYIQTLTKKGYRFVMPVTFETASSTTLNAAHAVENVTGGNGGVAQSAVEGVARERQSVARPTESGFRDLREESLLQPTKSDVPRAVAALHGTPAIGIPEKTARGERLSLRQVASDWHFRLSVAAALVVGFVIATYYFRRGTGESANPTVSGYTQLTHDGRKKSDGAQLIGGENQVYFWEYRGDGIVLVSVPVEGGEVTEEHLPPGFVVSDVSRGGSELLGNDREPDGGESLAALSLGDGSIRWLMPVRAPGNQTQWTADASWSPRRGRIAFIQPGQVLEAELGRKAIHQIARVDGWAVTPRWSPDGRRLVFSVLTPKAETYRLWEVNADGSHLYPLSFPGSGFTLTCCGSWTPDGKFLVFEAEQDGRRDLWAVRQTARLLSGGEEPVRLTSGPLNYTSPTVSADGEEVFALGEVTRAELMRYNLQSHSLAEVLGGISAAEVSYSRDGKRVVYVRYPDYTLWCANTDGSDKRELTDSRLEAREPRFSPDGKQIAFQGISREPGGEAPRYKIYLVSSAGGSPRELVAGAGEESVATWWPDGRSLLYDEPLFRHSPSQMFLYRLDLATRKSVRIPGSGGSWTARLSPDGRYIVTLDATWNADPHGFTILDAATGRRILTVAMPHLAEPTWSRDGKYIYFAVISSSDPALYRFRLRDRKLQRLTSLRGFPIAGLWTGVAPDGSPLLLRDTSTEEIYALHVRWP